MGAGLIEPIFGVEVEFILAANGRPAPVLHHWRDSWEGVAATRKNALPDSHAKDRIQLRRRCAEPSSVRWSGRNSSKTLLL